MSRTNRERALEFLTTQMRTARQLAAELKIKVPSARHLVARLRSEGYDIRNNGNGYLYWPVPVEQTNDDSDIDRFGEDDNNVDGEESFNA